MFEKYYTSKLSGKKYELEWCGLCEHYIIVCPKCENSSCNGSSCEYCHEDTGYFNKLKFHPFNYMAEDEIKVVEKYNVLKKLIGISIEGGREELILDKDLLLHTSRYGLKLLGLKEE